MESCDFKHRTDDMDDDDDDDGGGLPWWIVSRTS